MNFEDKTVDELNEMIAAAEAAKESARDREHTDLLRLADQVKTKAEALGIKPISLFRETVAAKPKYRNPNNPDETFNGRGPRPAWLKALVEGMDKKAVKEALKLYEISE